MKLLKLFLSFFKKKKDEEDEEDETFGPTSRYPLW
jgi:hypothetical protein